MIKQKWYSEKVKKYFDTEEEAKQAELALVEKEKQELEKQEARKAEANAVNALYEAYIEKQKEANKAYDKWVEAKNAFIKKHNYYHMTYKTEVDTALPSFLKSIFDIWNNW